MNSIVDAVLAAISTAVEPGQLAVTHRGIARGMAAVFGARPAMYDSVAEAQAALTVAYAERDRIAGQCEGVEEEEQLDAQLAALNAAQAAADGPFAYIACNAENWPLVVAQAHKMAM